jgi:hypothetical protein
LRFHELCRPPDITTPEVLQVLVPSASLALLNGPQQFRCSVCCLFWSPSPHFLHLNQLLLSFISLFHPLFDRAQNLIFLALASFTLLNVSW